MNIIQERNADQLTLKIEGRIDTKTAPKLDQVLQGALEGVKKLVFDLEETAYISSAGLRKRRSHGDF